MHANKPEMAQEWESHTKGKKLPMRAKACRQLPTIGQESPARYKQHVPGLIQRDPRSPGVSREAEAVKQHAVALKKIDKNSGAKNLFGSIAGGSKSNRVFFYSDKPPGWSLLEKLGVAKRGQGDRAELTEFGKELQRYQQGYNEHPEEHKKSQLLVLDPLFKATGGHKYRSRKKVGGKWVYEYDEPEHQPKHNALVEAIQKLGRGAKLLIDGRLFSVGKIVRNDKKQKTGISLRDEQKQNAWLMLPDSASRKAQLGIEGEWTKVDTKDIKLHGEEAAQGHVEEPPPDPKEEALSVEKLQPKESAKPLSPYEQSVAELKEATKPRERGGLQEGDPPGGWKEEDKVPEPSDSEKEAWRKRLAEAREKAAQRKQLKAELLTKFAKYQQGDSFKIGNTQYRVTNVAVYRDGDVHVGVVGPKGGAATLMVPKDAGQGVSLSTLSSVKRVEPEMIHAEDLPNREPKRPMTLPEEKPKKAPEGSPRAEAEKETQRMQDEGEYINDRSSKIEQRGEDVLGSARHKAADFWKSLREALSSADADKMFTRAFLTRQEPVDFVSKAQAVFEQGEREGRALSLMVGHFSLRKFPAKPPIKPITSSYDIYRLSSSERKAIGVTPGHSSMNRSSAQSAWESMPDSEKAAANAKRNEVAREAYYRAYQTVKQGIDAMSQSNDPMAAHLELVKLLREKMRHAYGVEYETLRKTHNALVGRGANSPLGQTNAFLVKAKNANPDADGVELLKGSKEPLLKVLEGKSINAAFDQVEKGSEKHDVAEHYDTSVMYRKGPSSEYKNAKQGLDMLDKRSGGKYQMRGVQWGKSVTDEEREHHLKSLVDSFADLSDVTGLPPEMSSFNGKLAIAVGARGKGSALAHYEKEQRVINLTRAEGAGALAHEWFHFFDHIVGGLTGGDSESFASGRYRGDAHSVQKAFNDFRRSPAWLSHESRLERTLREIRDAGDPIYKGPGYWLSNHEMFARCFERHVQRKLEKQGRRNTYLSGVKVDDLWPTDDEVDQMMPHFDKIFDEFKNSDLLKKALRLLGLKKSTRRLPMIGQKTDYYREQSMPDFEAIWGSGIPAEKKKAASDEEQRMREAGARMVHTFGFHGEPVPPKKDPKDIFKPLSEKLDTGRKAVTEPTVAVQERLPKKQKRVPPDDPARRVG